MFCNLKKIAYFVVSFFIAIFLFSTPVFAVYDHLKIEYWDGFGWKECDTTPSTIDVTQSVSFDIRITARDEFDLPISTGPGSYAAVTIDCIGGPPTTPSFPITDFLTNGQKLINVTFDLGSIPAGSSFITHHFEVEDLLGGYGKGNLYTKVHRFVNNFNVTLDVPGAKTAGTAFNVTVTARDSQGGVASTFSDDVLLGCAIGDMVPSLIAGSNFVNGQAAGFGVTLYGSDPVSRFNVLYATNTVIYPGQGAYPVGNTGNITVNPAAFDKILLLFPGETLVPATMAGTGKKGTPNPRISGFNFVNVQVFATDAFWNPLSAGPYPTLDFSSSDGKSPVLPAPGFPMGSNPQIFDTIILKESGDHWVRVKDNTKNTTSTSYPIRINAGVLDRFTFDNISNQITTTPFVVTVTALDSEGNIVTAYNKNNVPLKSTTDAPDPPGSTVVPNSLNFSNGIASTSINVTRRGGPGSYLTITDPDNPLIFVPSNKFSINHGPFTTLLALFNGESLKEGILPGKTGSPTDYVTAGDTVTVRVIATDNWYNRITDGSAALPLTISSGTGYIKSLDDGIALPPTGDSDNKVPPNYRVIFYTTASNVFPYSNESQRITAATGPVPAISGNSSYITIHPKAYNGLVLVAPGENLDPGSLVQPDGKTGTSTSQQSTNLFDLTAVAVDKYWNPVDGGSYTVAFSSSDPKAVLPVGNQAMAGSVKSFTNCSLDTLGWQWIKLADVNNASIFDTVVIEVVHGPLNHFTFTPIGSVQKVGNAFNVRIIAEDTANKKVLSYNGVTINLNCNTGAGSYTPATITFINGEWNGTVTINKAGSGVRLSCNDGVPSGNSNFFTVEAKEYTKLIILLPNEVQTPGVAPGKTGIVASKAAGSSVFATVLAVDDFWNTVTSAAPTVNLSTSQHSQIPINNTALTNGQGIFEIKFRAAGIQTAMVQDVNQVTITGTSSITINPGAYTKLQIIAPGEVPDPGGWEVDGKTNAPINQKTGEQFTVQVLAVDNFWNQVTSVNGGKVHLSSSDGTLVSPNQDSPYISGSSNLDVYLGKPGSVNVTAKDVGYLGKTPQTVNIVLNQGYVYEVIVPANPTAGKAGIGPFFNMTVRLVDPAFPGIPIVGQNPTIKLTPFLANRDPAIGALGVTNIALTNGQVIIGNQSYSIAEDICIKVSDSYARSKFSSSIHVTASALEYKVVVPTEAVVGPPNYFPVTVELRDTVTGNIVPAAEDREINLVIYSKDTGTPGLGVTGVSKVTISKGEGTATIQQSYTKAEEIYIRVSDAALVLGTSSIFTMKPAEYKRLQIIAPGENINPGIPSQTGKINAPGTWQAGIPFTVTVRAVDQYWNLVNFSGGKIRLVSSDSSLTDTNPSNQNAPFVTGAVSFTIKIHTPGDIKVTASDLNNSGKTPQSVDIPISFAVYNIVTPANASTNGTFVMLVNLVDGNTGNLVMADHNFTIIPLKANHDPAYGVLGVTSGAIVSGQTTINNQSYNILEDICIKIVDDYGRKSYSNTIHMQSSNLQYEIIVATQVPVGPPETFSLTLNLKDVTTGNLVTTMDHKVNITAYTSIGLPATGKLAVSSVYLKNGQAVISQAYAKIESIYLTATDPVLVVNDGLSANILVVAGKEVDLNLNVPSVLEAGQSTPVIASLKDGHGNIVSNLEVFFTLGGEAVLDKSSDFTDALGEASVNVTCNQYAQDGILVIRAYTGNISKIARITIKGVPKTSLVIKGAHTEVEQLIYAKPETPFTLSSESQIGIDAIYYKVDAAAWQQYVGEFFITEVGVHNISYYARDINGHLEQVKISKTIQISQAEELLNKAINYPNPFRAGKEPTFIEYRLNEPSNVTITIYDLLGQIVWKNNFRAGENGGSVLNSVAWWGINGLDEIIGNGGYICRIWIEKEKRRLIRKIAVVK